MAIPSVLTLWYSQLHKISALLLILLSSDQIPAGKAASEKSRQHSWVLLMEHLQYLVVYPIGARHLAVVQLLEEGLHFTGVKGIANVFSYIFYAGIG